MFNIKVKPTDLFAALEKVGKTVGKDRTSQYSFARCLYMEALDDNGVIKLRLITSSVQDTSEIVIGAIGSTNLGVCDTLIEFEKIHELMTTTKVKKASEIEFTSVDSNTLNVNFTGNKQNIELYGMESSKFILPSEDQAIHTFTANMKLLKDAVDRMASIVHEQSAMKAFNNLKLSFAANELIITGYDTTYLIPAMYKIADNFNFNADVHIDCQKLKRFLQSFDASKPAIIELTQNNMVVIQDGLRTTARLSAEVIPDISTAFTTSKIDFEIDKDELIDALKRIEILSEGEITQRRCTFAFFDDHIELYLNSKVGTNLEEVASSMIKNTYPADKNHIPFKIDFNIKGIKTAIESIPSPKIIGSFTTSKQVMLHSSGANSDVYQVAVSKLNSAKPAASDKDKKKDTEDNKPKEE